MCIAIVCPKGKTISDEIIRRCAFSNSDGGGMALMANDGKVIIDKGYMTTQSFIDRYHYHLENKAHERGPMLIHFRIATAGKVDRDNTHPFRVRGGAMIHNGIFWSGGFEDTMSDTRLLAAVLHNRFTEEAVSKHKKELGEVAGWNKMAFLHDSGNYTIINEDYGTWDDGVWYSNSGFCNTK